MKKLLLALVVMGMLGWRLMVGIVNADVLPMVRNTRGNYEILVTFSNGSRAYFMIDTGASTTTMSPETFISLAISNKVPMTYLGEGYAELADNSIVTTDHWMLGQMSLSPNVIVRNLEISVSPSGGSNLLGMNFLSQMGHWRFDSGNSTFITGQQQVNPPKNQLPPHVEAAGGQWFPARGYRWVNPSNIPGSGYAVIPVPNVVTTALTPPYTYTPALGYRWANPNDINGSGFAVVAVIPVSLPVEQVTTAVPVVPVVVPHQRVGNFILGMTKKGILKIGKPQDQITTGLSAGVELWRYVNKTMTNTLEVYFQQGQVSLICFTNSKFLTGEGISTVNFDAPNAMLTYVPGQNARFEFTEGGLFYLVKTREGCVIK